MVTLSCRALLMGRHVKFWVDNMVVKYVATKQSSRSPELMEEARSLFNALDLIDATNVEEWLPSAANDVADRLSREDDPGDWRLSPSVFAMLNLYWGPHTVDRFATENNTHLPRFNSAWAQPSSEGIDAFAQSNWRTEHNWCNPPWQLLPRLVHLLQKTGASATVIAPDWPAQPWYQQLSELAIATLPLPARAGLFRPGRLGGKGVGPARWSAVAFRVGPWL